MYKNLDSYKGISIGDRIVGRCVTTNRLTEGKVVEIRQWSDEYAPRFAVQDEAGRIHVVRNAEVV